MKSKINFNTIKKIKRNYGKYKKKKRKLWQQRREIRAIEIDYFNQITLTIRK